jgi:hypothetical protein
MCVSKSVVNNQPRAQALNLWSSYNRIILPFPIIIHSSIHLIYRPPGTQNASD